MSFFIFAYTAVTVIQGKGKGRRYSKQGRALVLAIVAMLPVATPGNSIKNHS